MATVAAEQTESLAELSQLIALQAELAAQSSGPIAEGSEFASVEVKTGGGRSKGKAGDGRGKNPGARGKKG